MTRARPLTRMLVPAVLGLLLIAGGPVPGLAQTAPPQDLRQQFREADRNSDGKIDREEFHLRITEIFYMRDRNRNGYLVREELADVSQERFRAADTNGDGRLSLQEFLSARHRDFDAADTNGDGVLVIEEIEAYLKTRP